MTREILTTDKIAAPGGPFSPALRAGECVPQRTGRTRPGYRATHRDGWDAELADGTLCRLAQDGRAWYLDAVYD